MGKGIMKAFAASGNKMKIIMDPLIGRPIDGEGSAKLASQIGVITRDVLPVPKKWKDIWNKDINEEEAEKFLKPGFDHLNVCIKNMPLVYYFHLSFLHFNSYLCLL